MQQVPRHSGIPQVHSDRDTRSDLHPVHGLCDIGTERARPVKYAKAARPHGHHGAKGYDGQGQKRAHDENAPAKDGLVLGYEAHEEGDERGFGHQEADGGEVEEDIFEDDGEVHV